MFTSAKLLYHEIISPYAKRTDLCGGQFFFVHSLGSAVWFDDIVLILLFKGGGFLVGEVHHD